MVRRADILWSRTDASMQQERKLKLKNLFAFPESVINQHQMWILRNLLVLNLGPDQKDTQHSILTILTRTAKDRKFLRNRCSQLTSKP